MAARAIVGGVAYRIVIPQNIEPSQALVELTVPGRHNPPGLSDATWLETVEGYKIQRSLIEALGVGELSPEGGFPTPPNLRS